MSWSCWWLLPLKAKWWKEDDVMIILVTRSTSLGWSDSWISQPPWVSDQGWSRQQEWGTTWSEIWKLMKICGLAQIVSLRYCKWIKTIDTIECYGIRLLRAIQATPRIIRACPESMSHTFWSCVVVTPDGHLDWGGSWPGRSLRDSGKPIPGKQIQNFPSTPIGVKLLCSIIHCHRSDPEHLTMQIDWKRKVLDHPLVPI